MASRGSKLIWRLIREMWCLLKFNPENEGKRFSETSVIRPLSALCQVSRPEQGRAKTQTCSRRLLSADEQP